jgi:amino acid adenylation domain-containing protein/thioester reductase-like protein
MSIDLKNASIHQLFEIQAVKTPDAVAVVFETQQLTYQELNRKANQWAHYLNGLGVRSETLVGVCVERSLEMLIVLLGILKAGGAYVPLDPSYPVDRLALMIEDAELPILVTQQKLLPNLPPTSAKVIYLEDSIEPSCFENPDRTVTSENLAYTIYTSGSTGKPKGVQILHGAVVNFLQSMQEAPGITAQDTLLAITTISFDIAVLELFLPLTVGARIAIASREVASDATQLIQLIEQSEATILQATPATWRMILASGWQGNSRLKILCGGEALTRALADQLLDRAASLWNLYGPTETTIWSMIHRVEHDDRPVPLGMPIANTQIYVVQELTRRKEDTLKLAAVGEIGELYIGGQGIARGYLNRPELTCDRFVSNPFSPESDARLYRTGDLARVSPDGRIEIVGRADHQVKIRGYRIELGDIETALSQHSAIRESVVIAREDSAGNPQLVAYVVAQNLRSIEIRSWLKERLPSYMVPATVVFMDRLPLTPNLKVDRRALPAPTFEIEEEVVLPRTELEQKMADLWTAVLETEVGVYQNFFESGGDSLRTALLLTRMREAFQMDLSLECLFKAPTIAALAEVIEAMESCGSSVGFNTTPEELWTDATLDESICPQPVAISGIPQRVFLTGATGFIGAFLLQELLQSSQVSVYCLVRADNLELASDRLRQVLERYQLWQDSFGSRIIPILGDLSQPRFGLTPSQFEELADRIDAIYHSGAYVNLVYPYPALRDANVLGTQEVLRFATQMRTIPVHYISTIDVFHSTQYEDANNIPESDELASCEGYSEGYAQSKWVAEKLVMAARDRSLPVCIYRLGMITGHSQTGAFQLDNMICRMIKGFMQMGCAPDLDLPMYLAPVDYITQAIAHLSRQPKSFGKTFHLVSPHSLSIQQFVADLNRLDCAIDLIPYRQWQTKLHEMPPENTLTPMASMFTKRSAEQSYTLIEKATFTQSFEATNAQIGLGDTDITCPQITISVLQNYLSYFQRQAFLPHKHSSLFVFKA